MILPSRSLVFQAERTRKPRNHDLRFCRRCASHLVADVIKETTPF